MNKEAVISFTFILQTDHLFFNATSCWLPPKKRYCFKKYIYYLERWPGKGLSISRSILNNISEDSFQMQLQVRLGVYKLQIEARLEDLAGNNLNRLFDRD